MVEYKPGLPEDNNNVSHQAPFREFTKLAVSVLLTIAAVYWVLGLLIDVAADHLSYEHEARLFKSLPINWNDVLGAEPVQNSRLQSLVNDLQKCSNFPVKINVTSVANAAPNALALPGGQMLVYDALLDHVQSENGLAFVLAHELGHFINHDHTRGMGRGLVLMSMAYLLTGSDSSLTRLLTPSFELTSANFSQNRETEADNTALEILTCHYGHVSGATEFFESLKLKAQNDSGLNHYFSTHPQISKRIASIKKWEVDHDLVSRAVVPLSD